MLTNAAKGQDDESKYVIDFADEAEKVFDDIDDEDGCEATHLTSDAAALNADATLLATYFKIQPPSKPEDSQYGAVAKAGNNLFRTVGIDDARLIPAKCHGQVNESEECTALS